MNPEIEKYFAKVSNCLERLPQSEREEILMEISNHVYEATSNGETASAVLEHLGSPEKLAASYTNSYVLDSGNIRFGVQDMLRNLTFYSGTAFSGIFVIPIFGSLAFAFALTAVLLLGISVVNLTGFISIPFNLGSYYLASGIPQVLAAVIIGAGFMFLAVLSWNFLKKYLAHVSKKYRELHMGKRPA